MQTAVAIDDDAMAPIESFRREDAGRDLRRQRFDRAGALYQANLNARGDGKRNGPVRYFTRKGLSEMVAGFSDSIIAVLTKTPVEDARLQARRAG